MAKNSQKVQLTSREIVRRKVLVLGETGSGKTKLVAELLQELMTLIDPAETTIIDLAPKRFKGVGGKLTDYVNLDSRTKCLSPKNVYTPRLAGTSPEEVLHYAELNRKNMEPLLERFIKNPTEALILNDVTLYLHLGRLEIILKCARSANTFLATAYYGSKLLQDFGTEISSRERRLTDELATHMDLAVKIK